jgi:hypothetical protein
MVVRGRSPLTSSTATLFFASVNRVVPFYGHPVPLWDELSRRAGGVRAACCRAVRIEPRLGMRMADDRISGSSPVPPAVGSSATYGTRSFGDSHTALFSKFQFFENRAQYARGPATAMLRAWSRPLLRPHPEVTKSAGTEKAKGADAE